ncbi:MAG: putative ribosomal RNA small subunit methyltransferase A [Methanomassiliicoccales archaeon PtaU1.Bin124]|nr:MAG: putative ribosomal RNA small subunit methyltransferase A [Methanomassiliicoccales archaeon PtaU1.Bin124]
MRPTEIKAFLASLSLTPTKGKGQNFLTDDRVADHEVLYLDIKKGERVLEVGPGLGMLTERLLLKTERLQAIELDSKLVPFLTERFGNKLDLIVGDALEIRWPRFDKFISNVPYNISSPLIFKLLEHDFSSAIIMVQKEFADRMGAEANTDDYGRLSVGVYYRAKCDLLEVVKRNAFWPEPEVDSRIVRLTPRPPPFQVKDEKLFFKLVDMCFAQRRKKISTVLKKSRVAPEGSIPSLPYMDDRVEALTPEQIGELADAVWLARNEEAT